KSLPVLQIADQATSRPLTIATVTSPDANFYSETPEAIAQQWKRELEREIETAADLYSSEKYLSRLQRTALIPLGLIIWTGLLILGRALIRTKLKLLLAQYEQDLRASSADPNETAERGKSVANGNDKTERHGPGLGSILREQRSLGNQIESYRSINLAILWIIILSWYFGFYIVSTRLPTLLAYSSNFLTQPLYLLVIWFFITLVLRISHSLIRSSVNAWKENPQLIFGNAKRQILRSKTIDGALRGLATFTLVSLGILFTLAQLGLPASSILTGSALVGLAITFGAQSLVKDVVNGSLIILEDQFAVGDVVTINHESGLVEQLNLRITQLRNIDGELISIPNSSIAMVKNKTSSWSRVNLGLEVAYSTDLDQAIAVINEVAVQMSHDPEWQEFILEPPNVLGVDAFGENSITIRLWIRTEPGQQFPMGREFRRRIKLAFDEAGITIPFPQRSVWIESELDNQRNGATGDPSETSVPD
ncbi:MAG: mechanosensitive ion channel family protein, partial [Cyanobacteria bacterium P01_F01_bin.42]